MRIKNAYLRIRRIEFSVTNACTGRCRHCSLGGKLRNGGPALDAERAAAVVAALAAQYTVESVMTFGGEPLLYPDVVCAVHRAAAEAGVPQRQVITNGCFTRDGERLESVAAALGNNGVNDLLISVDAFHQESLPLDTVLRFAAAARGAGIARCRLNPAWVVNRQHINPYNAETERCLARFESLGLPVSRGNDITPSGNAALHLAEYYPKRQPELDVPCGAAPYTSRLDDVDCISIDPNGDVIVCCLPIGNIGQDDIACILRRYAPYDNPFTAALLRGGVRGLMAEADARGVLYNPEAHRSACGVCREIIKAAFHNEPNGE